VSEHCTLPTVYLHVKQTARTSTGTCANTACGHSLSSVQQLCQTSAGNRQTNSPMLFVSTIRNWHCTLLFLSVQNVRHHVTKCVWYIYNTGTLFYLIIHIITFTQFHAMASSEVLTALHICHESESTCLVQHTAVNVLLLLSVFLQKVLKVFPSAHRHDSHLTNTLFIACYKFYRITLRLLMSYIYGVHILDVSRSHTMTHRSQ
jgi:hypothetical protein